LDRGQRERFGRQPVRQNTVSWRTLFSMATDIKDMRSEVRTRRTTSITVHHDDLDELHALAANLSAGQPRPLTMRQALRFLLDNYRFAIGADRITEGN
jgi:hypothetical protein